MKLSPKEDALTGNSTAGESFVASTRCIRKRRGWRVAVATDTMQFVISLALGSFLLSSVVIDAFLWSKTEPKPELKLCGVNGYDPLTHICCVDQVYNRKKATEECCDYKVFDVAIEQCCYKMIIMKNERCFKPVPSIKGHNWRDNLP
ncbi:hypothetical protein LSAT2_009068 [Lamellibrachia satsuma]|nr:hypothetical protein LSAT2_009068 [Lamellibrachia satsuma]